MFMGFKVIFSKYLVFYNVGGWESHAEVLFKFLPIKKNTVWIFSFVSFPQGPLGVEGIFRRSCEVTLRVMRDQMDPLMRWVSRVIYHNITQGVDFIHVSYKWTAFLLSVLRTFIHDPLVEWRKKSKNQKMNPADTELALGEIHNDQVRTNRKS